ncbi:hypothetical protein INT48_000444 [Thamnidium elegans]|uniref:Uncharacterized protein n=1 Tax=Thamnidium elegans TaxID=101142 RepID=A0A8H7SJN9_9FUNG|nr:hypothetical protein INT48_000444 [Thamnidium elegans]
MSNVPFPLIVPVDEENKIYKGYIPIHNKEYLIQVQLGHHLVGSPELEQLVNQCKKVIEIKLKQATDIMSFLIGFDRIETMSDTMEEIIFKTRDDANRDHLLKVMVPTEYPFVPLQISCELPNEMTEKYSMSQVLLEHETIVKKYQVIFNCLDDLDKNMNIIEPEQPKRNDFYRRIALGNHCSFYIQFELEYQGGKPKHIRFFGSQNNVQELKSNWKSYQWCKQESIHQNLLNVFQVQSTIDYTNTSDIECGICYSYNLNNQLPQVILVTF